MRHADASDARVHPLIGHWGPRILLNSDGSLMAISALSGLPAELAGAQAIIQAAMQDNSLARGLTDDRLEIWDHFVRLDQQQMPALPPVPNWFGAEFDREYHGMQSSSPLYSNDLFVTVVMHPNSTVGPVLSGWRGKANADPEDEFVAEFESVLQKLDASLARYGCRPLSVREEAGRPFSEPAEALHLIANGKYRPIGLVRQRMGRLLTPERLIFGHTDFHIQAPGLDRFGALLTFHDYPSSTRPGMFAELHRVPFPIILTSALRFHQRGQAVTRIGRRARQMKASEDVAQSQIAELERDADDIQSGRSVYVNHHWSAAVYASTLEDLDRRVARVQSLLSDVGVTAARESAALQPAYLAQLPGNRRWRTRPGQVKSTNVVGLSARHGVLRGEGMGRWGAPVMVLRTTSDTKFNFHFHAADPNVPAADLGHCLIIGKSGSGKTSFMASACLLALRNPHVRVVVVDKDYGMSAMILAAGGSYMVLPSGKPSGLAPLRGLSDTPEDKAFLRRWIEALILSDGNLVPMTPDENDRLDRAIALQMRMPEGMRGLGGVAAMLGHRNQTGAGARLRRWCQGEGLGWAFDNTSDDLDMDKRIVGFETAALFRDPIISAPTLSYLFYRTTKLIDGRPFLLAVDEMWQADRVAAFREQNNDHLKTLRKQEGAMMLATQSARDALNSPIAHTIREQIPTKIFFGDDAADYGQLVDGMGLTDAEYLAVKEQLPNMPYTFLLKRPSGSVLCKFDLSGDMGKVAVVSARESTFRLMNKLRAIHGPDPQSWVPHYEMLAPRLAADPALMAEAAE